MAILPIRVYPDPVLHKRAAEVEEITAELRQLIEDMVETMYAAPGVGLAAPQVGVLKRIIVIDIGNDDAEKKRPHQLFKLVNPVIVEGRGETVCDEGCLSVPDIRENVKRKEWVKVEALDENGQPVVIETDGLLAICLQHEIDHLDGVLFIDNLSSVKRAMIKSKLRKKK